MAEGVVMPFYNDAHSNNYLQICSKILYLNSQEPVIPLPYNYS